MNKKRLAVAVGVALAASAVAPMAQADATVYGKLRFSTDYVQTQVGGVKDPAQSELISHASRIGFKGQSAIQGYNDLSVVYQAEYGIDGQVQGGNNWSARNTFVGLKGNFGGIMAGISDTPFKNSQGKVDQFNDLDGDLAAIFDGEDRLNQSVWYNTPSMGPVKASIAYVMSNTNGSNVANTVNRDGVSAAVMMSQGMFYGAVAYNKDINNMDSVRVTGVVKPVSALQLGAMFQQSKCADMNAPVMGHCNGNSKDAENGFLVSAGYTIGKATLKAEYGSSNIYKISTKANYNKDMSVGASYKLDAKTNLEGWVTQLKNDAANNTKTTYVALGLQHKF